MIYFCCTSMFQVFVILFMLSTEYKSTSKKKVLILLDHVQSLMIIKDNLIRSKLWDEIIIINTENASLEEINNQLDQFKFTANDIYHLMGREYVGFSIYNRFPVSAKTILTCETIVSNVDVKHSINEFYKKEWFHGSEFDFSKFDEIWSWDTKLTMTNYNLPEKQLDIVQALKDIEFKKYFIKLLKDIFNINDVFNETNNLIYFDTYLVTANNMVSEDVERVLLNEISYSIGDFGLKIKRHPGDRNTSKYHNLNATILANSYVPWEVLRLLEFENSNNGEQYIYLTYGSAALFHERWLFNNYDSHLIFLNKILEQFSDKTLSGNDFMPKFIEIYGDKNIYFPENFTELKEIVWNIRNPETKMDINAMLIEEKNRISKWFINEYKKNYDKIPSPNNISTLMADYGNGFISITEVPFSIDNKNDFIFNFTLPSDKRKSIKRLMWYAVRGRNVKIKLNKIRCEHENNSYNFDLSEVHFDGKKDESGIVEILSYDPCFEFPLKEEVSSISIHGEWLFEDSYQSMILFNNKIAENNIKIINNYVKLNNQLLQDLGERDNVIKQLLTDINGRDRTINNLLKDIDGRDLAINNLSNDIIERDKTISTLLNDINDRDQNYNNILQYYNNPDFLQITNQRNQRATDNTLQEKNNYIAFLENELNYFRNSRYWKLKNRLLKKK